MRKVLWCCLAAGAVVCCAVGIAAYVWQNPDSALGRLAQAADQVGAHPGAADADAVIPPDPVPVEEPSDPPAVPVLPGAASHPQVVAALDVPLIVHDEEDLNGSSGPDARPEPPAAARVDVEASRPSTFDLRDIAVRLDGDARVDSLVGPHLMPHCGDDAGAVPIMPPCADDGSAPAMPPAADDGTLGRGMHPPGAFTWWIGFFSGPSPMTPDSSAGRCEEDAHYGQQYPGVPYTGGLHPADQPARSDVKAAPAFPGLEENSEPPAQKAAPHGDPLELFGHPHHTQKPQPVEPESDTMEMRPSDWKPYSLDPGPF